MLHKYIKIVVFPFVVLFAIALPLQAAEYEVCTNTDSATDSDLALLDSILSNSADGDAVPASVRRIVMASVGEFNLAADNKITDDGVLTLDDGSQVYLVAGDKIKERKCVDVVPNEFIHVYFDIVEPGQGPEIKKERLVCRPVEICRGKSCMTIPPVEIKHKL
jgi:hypothetical protein